MKRFLALAMALCIVLGMVACSSNTNNGSEETASNNSTSATIETDIAHDAEMTVENTETSFEQDETQELADAKICFCMAATRGGTPFHDEVIAKLQEIAANDPGLTVDFLEAQSTADWEPNLLAAANGGYDLILGFCAQMKDTMIKVAEQYPDQKFVCIDNCIVGMDNVVSVGGNCNEGCYIAGVFCAMLTTRTEIPHINPEKKVAYVSGKDTPYGLDGYAGFVQGVHDVDPEIEVITVYGDSFSDPAGMKEWVLSAIEAGADCMYAMAGNGVYGAIEGCQEGGAYLVGHDGNYDEAGAGYVATSFCRAMYIPVVQVVYDFRAGNWDGDSVYLCTFTNGGLGFTNGDYFKQMVGEDVFPQDIFDALKPYMEKVSDRTIVVDEYPDFRPYDASTYTIHS